MKRLLIIGARGYGRVISWVATNCVGYNTEFTVKGFLDDKVDALEGMWSGYPPIISSVEDYEPESDDVFICALGDIKYRKYYADIIMKKDGQFINLIEREASVHPSVKMGVGNIITNYCSLSCEVELGDFNTMQRGVNCGHDAKIGDCCHLGAKVFLGGGVVLENNVTLHPGCSINPQVRVEHDACVGANSVAIRRVKAHTTVFGIPAKKVEY